MLHNKDNTSIINLVTMYVSPLFSLVFCIVCNESKRKITKVSERKCRVRK